jgi:hypothetical protein
MMHHHFFVHYLSTIPPLDTFCTTISQKQAGNGGNLRVNIMVIANDRCDGSIHVSIIIISNGVARSSPRR